jgi:UDP-2,3-diacylglucosamine hydrolase
VVEFISDLHLCAEAARTARAFRHYLAHTDADALCILGDLFEVWIGDDTREQAFERECLSALATFGARRDLFFMAGNRDFLLGEQACAAARMKALPDPMRLDAFGQSLLLSHGDALCLADTDYQAFRRVVRSPPWQQDFLARSIGERAALARHIRNESQGRRSAQADPMAYADVDPDAARQWLQATGATTLVHGHTHRPGHDSLGPGLERRVLADWDLDAPSPRGAVLRLDAAGWHVRPVADQG